MLLNVNTYTKLSRIYRKPNATQNSFKLLFLNNIATGELYREGVRGAASPPEAFNIGEILIRSTPCYFQRENTVSLDE